MYSTFSSWTKDMGASWNSDPIPFSAAFLGAIQLSWDGASTGTLVLQASNDETSPTVWTDLPWSSITMSSSPALWNVEDAGYRWVRVKFTRTGGTGTGTIAANTKVHQ